jgi:hypothetical protein
MINSYLTLFYKRITIVDNYTFILSILYILMAILFFQRYIKSNNILELYFPVITAYNVLLYYNKKLPVNELIIRLFAFPLLIVFLIILIKYTYYNIRIIVYTFTVLYIFMIIFFITVR